MTLHSDLNLEQLLRSTESHNPNFLHNVANFYSKMRIMPDIITGITLAFRARYLAFFFWITTFLVAGAVMAAQFSGRQPATVALDLGISIIRIGLPIMAAIILQEILSREFDRKFFLTCLTYPRPRHVFLIGRFIAANILALALLITLGFVLAAVTALISAGYEQSTPPAIGTHYAVTLSFIALDLLATLSIGTLIAVSAATPSFVFVGTIGFTLIARSYSSILELLTLNSTLVADAHTYKSSLSLLGYVFPDLAALDVRTIALYGKWEMMPSDWEARVISALAYALGALGLATWALSRKTFD